MESEKNIQEVIIKRVKIGRPKNPELSEEDRKNYRKNYYEKNKDKYMGDFLCVHCQCIISKSNKTRHNATKIHILNIELNLLKEKEFNSLKESI
jgi:hypothetical protein